MGKASLARGGTGRISKSRIAREGMLTKAMGDVPVTDPDAQPAVPSNIPGATSAGVPSALPPRMAAFTRDGNEAMTPTIIGAMRGMLAYGPARGGSVARTGGQVRVAPGQFGVWANPL